jgi:hypothetical protein
MINSLSRSRILGAVVLILVSGSVVLATIDPSIRPMFLESTKVVVLAYIRSRSSHQTRDKNNDRPSKLGAVIDPLIKP